MAEAADGWSEVAPVWARLWGSFADPARRALLTASAVGPGIRVLDMGCGSGEFLASIVSTGADAIGIDPAPEMVDAARRLVPAADVRDGSWEDPGLPSSSVDVLTAVNSVQFADDLDDALGQAFRLLRPGGVLGMANWAEGGLNDLDAVNTALAAAADEDELPESPLRGPGALEAIVAAAGFAVEEGGLVSCPWVVSDGNELVAGLLLGEDPSVVRDLRNEVLAAAAPFRAGDRGYRFENSFRWFTARRP